MNHKASKKNDIKAKTKAKHKIDDLLIKDEVLSETTNSQIANINSSIKEQF